MTIPTVGQVTQSVQVAGQTGMVSPKTVQVLTQSVNTGVDLGISPEQITSEKVTLCIVLADDSGSMSGSHSTVVHAFNDKLIRELKQGQTRHEVLLAITSLFHGVLLPFTKVSALEQFDGRDYQPDGGSTPLYRGVRDTLQMAVAKQGELALAGIPARIMFLVYTDGGENEHDVNETELSQVVIDLDGRKENALYGIAVGGGAESSLRAIGLKRVVDAGSPIGLSEAFQQFSRATSAAAAS